MGLRPQTPKVLSMDPTYHLRKTMLSRLLRAAGVAAIAAPAITAAACGGKVIVDGVMTGGEGGAGGASGMSNSSGASCTLTSTGVITGPGGAMKTQVTGCIAMGTSGCPNQYQAMGQVGPSASCMFVSSI